MHEYNLKCQLEMKDFLVRSGIIMLSVAYEDISQ